MATPMIHVSRAVLRDMLEEYQRQLPAECCGLLLGTRGRRGRPTRIEAALCLRNGLSGAAALRGFRLDPVEVLRAEREAQQAGRVVLGPWHSHPGGSAQLSQRDREGAGGYRFQFLLPAALDGPTRLVIWGLDGSVWQRREWLEDENASPMELENSAGGPGRDCP